MKRNIFISALLALLTLLPMSAWAQTDAEYNAALAQIQDFHKYYISATKDGTIYYLKSDGTVTTNKAEATSLDFIQRSGGAYKDKGFSIGLTGTSHFTNPSTTGGSGSGDISNSGKINTTSRTEANNIKTWDAQVFFLNDGGKYAVRATNATGSTYKPNTYWDIVEYNSEQTAGYSESAAYIWSLEDDGYVAQTTNRLEFALSTITAGNRYRITTTVSSTKYYITGTGELSTTESDAGVFTFAATGTNKYVSAGQAFQLANGESRFSNVNLDATKLNVTTANKRDDFEAQVFYFNGEHYAVRSTNATGTEYNQDSYWTVKDNSGTPYASIGEAGVQNYIWDLEEALSFDHSVTYTIRSARSGSYVYLQSPVYNNGSLNLARTSNEAEAMKLIITGATGNSFYLYDMVSGYYVTKAANTSNGTAWTLSTTPSAVEISKTDEIAEPALSGTQCYLLKNGSTYANADGGVEKSDRLA
ncbi:MAG: hypothetical protein IJT48_12230, partial [Bacteroidaceae bacterium]|nr:hypothetical protein [Bacteroidaceae bacterium]